MTDSFVNSLRKLGAVCLESFAPKSSVDYLSLYSSNLLSFLELNRENIDGVYTQLKKFGIHSTSTKICVDLQFLSSSEISILDQRFARGCINKSSVLGAKADGYDEGMFEIQKFENVFAPRIKEEITKIDGFLSPYCDKMHEQYGKPTLSYYSLYLYTEPFSPRRIHYDSLASRQVKIFIHLSEISSSPATGCYWLSPPSILSKIQKIYCFCLLSAARLMHRLPLDFNFIDLFKLLRASSDRSRCGYFFQLKPHPLEKGQTIISLQNCFHGDFSTSNTYMRRTVLVKHLIWL